MRDLEVEIFSKAVTKWIIPTFPLFSKQIPWFSYLNSKLSFNHEHVTSHTSWSYRNNEGSAKWTLIPIIVPFRAHIAGRLSYNTIYNWYRFQSSRNQLMNSYDLYFLKPQFAVCPRRIAGPSLKHLPVDFSLTIMTGGWLVVVSYDRRPTISPRAHRLAMM